MRFSLANLIVRSPLPHVHLLMERVSECTEKLPALIEAVIAGKQDDVARIAKEISKLEGKADEIKNEVRAHLPAKFFLSVDRRDLLRLIKQIDSMADDAEDVGVLLTMRPMEVPEDFRTLLGLFVERVMSCVATTSKLVAGLESLHQAGFSGKLAADAEQTILEVSRQEHETDKIQDQIAKLLFQHEADLPAVSIFMWSKILAKLGGVANHAENVADHFRLFIAR